MQKIIALHNNELPSYAKISGCHVRKHPFEKTSSKKIIRDKYFEAKKTEVQASGNIKKPENRFQQELYDLLSEIMGNKLFGTNSNLYNNGLDSLGSILFIEELHKKLGENINLTDLMENNTILKLEQYFENKRNANKIDLSTREVYPLTNMQKYFAYIIKGNTTGNLPFTFQLDGSVDLEKLKKAIEDTIDAHPGLKAIIKFDKDSYKVFRNDARKIDIPLIHLTETEWEEKKKEILVPFAYNADDNLFHIYIFQTEKAKYLFFDVSHIMGDGVTMNILLEDVNKLYNGEKIENETVIYNKPILLVREKVNNILPALDEIINEIKQTNMVSPPLQNMIDKGLLKKEEPKQEEIPQKELSEEEQIAKQKEQEKQEFIQKISIIRGEDKTMLLAKAANKEQIEIISVYDISGVFEVRDQNLLKFYIIDAVLIVLCGCLTTIFARVLTKPIKKLNETTKLVAKGNLDIKIDIKGNDEIRELSKSFVSMIESIKNRQKELELSIKQREDFISNFTHELKTPMTSIMGYTKILNQNKYKKEDPLH